MNRREGSTPETGGSPPPGGPLWCPPAPAGDGEMWFSSTANSKWRTWTRPNREFDRGQVETLQIFWLEATFKAEETV